MLRKSESHIIVNYIDDMFTCISSCAGWDTDDGWWFWGSSHNTTLHNCHRLSSSLHRQSNEGAVIKPWLLLNLDYFYVFFPGKPFELFFAAKGLDLLDIQQGTVQWINSGDWPLQTHCVWSCNCQKATEWLGFFCKPKKSTQLVTLDINVYVVYSTRP